ncbi:MAG: ABC transporter substrate-binding protein [Defluviitaleaceae bacterium]|nr:ABC transporter substrate-binding protein [Defluviitaleaceae bacterium]
MKKFLFAVILLMLSVAVFTACGSDDTAQTSSDVPLEELRGTTVTFYGWGGSSFTNNWLDNIVAPSFYEEYGITLHRVPMDIGDILNKLIGERQANASGDIDVVWINGENFYTALNAGLLYGPITHRVENFARYLDPTNPDNLYDFGTHIGGMQVPYGRAQLVFAGDTAVLDSFPTNAQELMEMARANPNRFTYVAPPDFTGSAFVRNLIYEIVGFEALFDAPNCEDTIYEIIRPALDFMIELKPYLWQEGRTYPTSTAMLNDMFADGLAVMAISYTPLFVAQMILAGEFPKTTQTFVFDNGNIGNTHYMAIPFNAPNSSAALRLINHIISPEIQITKYDARNWGDFPVFDVNRLNPEQLELLNAIDNGAGILTAAQLQDHRLPEVQAYKIPIIDRLWIEHVLMH